MKITDKEIRVLTKLIEAVDGLPFWKYKIVRFIWPQTHPLFWALSELMDDRCEKIKCLEELKG